VTAESQDEELQRLVREGRRFTKGGYHCPRCKGRCFRLLRVYWDSPHVWLCPVCCAAAASHYDEVGWPPVPEGSDLLKPVEPSTVPESDREDPTDAAT